MFFTQVFQVTGEEKYTITSSKTLESASIKLGHKCNWTIISVIAHQELLMASSPFLLCSPLSSFTNFLLYIQPHVFSTQRCSQFYLFG